MQDIDISRNAKLSNIIDIAKKIEIDEEYIEQYGKYKAKISHNSYKKLENKNDGKLILVTAITPTTLGEGKTTVSIGIADALSKLNKKSILALREPSMGPVFGVKGGATGGGYAQIAPMEDINLHFTGDIHAITSANNLLAAMIDNHIYFGNELKIKKVVWKRCLDVNDRQLRKIESGLSDEKNTKNREESFDISVASETMAIFCLAQDLQDLKQRLGNIIIGYNENNEPIRARDLKAEGVMTAILKDAFSPNLVQTLENTPAIVHGGPFANIAHGCNSLVATKLALKLGDYVITEAGFGSDLGAEKFLNIKTRYLPKAPDAVVLVATIKALKYHGGMSKDDIKNEGIQYLENGFVNLEKHIKNIKDKFKLNVVVAINKYEQDTDNEIKYLENKLKDIDIDCETVECWKKGGNGTINLAEKLLEICNEYNEFEYIYSLEDSIIDKIRKISTQIYGAKDVEFTEQAIAKIEKIEQMGYNNLPVCIAKTQYSFSDNINEKEEYEIHIQDIDLKAGAGFIVALAGKIYTMPGLPKIPAAENIDLDSDGNIIGIY